LVLVQPWQVEAFFRICIAKRVAKRDASLLEMPRSDEAPHAISLLCKIAALLKISHSRRNKVRGRDDQHVSRYDWPDSRRRAVVFVRDGPLGTSIRLQSHRERTGRQPRTHGSGTIPGARTSAALRGARLQIVFVLRNAARSSTAMPIHFLAPAAGNVP